MKRSRVSYTNKKGIFGSDQWQKDYKIMCVHFLLIIMGATC